MQPANENGIIVTAAAIGVNNSQGRMAFDETVAVFDVDVSVNTLPFCCSLLIPPSVDEYLSGTGNRGGPLVTTANQTVQSDLRLYTSDNNVTMER